MGPVRHSGKQAAFCGGLRLAVAVLRLEYKPSTTRLAHLWCHCARVRVDLRLATGLTRSSNFHSQGEAH
eukprot:1541541-Rhodomonas_salina.1